MRILIFLFLLPVLQASAQSSLDTKIVAAVAGLHCALPDQERPVQINAAVVAEKDSLAVIIKTSLAPGWHIYDYVPSTLPYIPIEYVLRLPEGIRAVGEWKKTASGPSMNDRGVLIYENEAVFIRKVVKLPGAKANGLIKTGLYYQACDLNQCLPPVENLIELNY